MDTYFNKFVLDIFQTLIPQLEENPSYRFNWAEVGFLNMWWQQADIGMKERFKNLVDRGQIQFVGGGWVQHDEATVEYFNAMENLETGWSFLEKTFGVRPHVGWQLDPFGYSAVTPTLLESYGFDSLFITRVGTQVKDQLRNEGHLQFIWKGHGTQGKGVFVTVGQGELYTVTHMLKYDVLTPRDDNTQTDNICSLDDILNDKLSCLDLFVYDIISNHMNTTDKHSSNASNTFHIPALFGDDFAYTNASHNFLFINKLAQLLNEHSFERFGVQISMKYSTVDEYLIALRSDSQYPVYRGDFLPYLQEVQCQQGEKGCLNGRRIDHWTGYYSTRTPLKAQIRQMFNLLRTSKKLYSTFKYNQNLLQGSQYSSEVIATPQIALKYQEAAQQASILLHHDAITGTHSLAVKRDYEQRITETILLLEDTNSKVMNLLDEFLLKTHAAEPRLQKIVKNLLQIFNQNQMTIKRIRVFNPQITSIDGKILKVKANKNQSVVLLDANLEALAIQKMSIIQWEIFSATIQENQDEVDLYFFIEKQLPLALTSFILLQFESQKTCLAAMASQGLDPNVCFENSHELQFEDEVPSQHSYLENEELRINLSSKDGTIQSVTQKTQNITIELSQQFLAYDGKILTNSGLYIFNPVHEAQDFQYDMKFVKAFIFEGELMKCIIVMHQVTRYRDLLFQHRVCLENLGENKIFYKQQLRAYSSGYNEIVFRTEILSTNGIDSKAEQINRVGFFTDDSMKAIKRKVYSNEEAFKLGYDSGDDKSTQGLNSYPCNQGLILNINDLNQQWISMGVAISHPLLCNFIQNASSNKYEIMLSRSVHNSDLKGLRSLRNTELSLSELDIISNLNLVADQAGHTRFRKGYNLAKESVSEKDLVIIQDISNVSDSMFIGDIKPFYEDICDSTEVEFMRATFTEDNRCFDFTLRNTMSFPVHLGSESFKKITQDSLKRYDLKKVSLRPSDQDLRSFIASNETILDTLKPSYEVYEDLYQYSLIECISDLCLAPSEMAILRMCQRQTRMEQQVNSPSQSQIDNEQSSRRRRNQKREYPIEGDTSTHQCFKFTTIIMSILALLGSTAFLIYSILTKKI